MAAKRLRPSLSLAALLSVAISIVAAPAMAAPESHQTGQVTVFWGRHKDEGSLREACDSGMYTGIIMSFLNVDSHGTYHLDLSGHQLAGVGDDIKHCQAIGVPVSLSIRGNISNSRPSDKSALDLADHIWNAYLGGYRKGVHRPFGDAKLDGVDLFLDRGTPAKQKHYGDVLARELGKHNMGGGTRKAAIHLTATLPCDHPTGGDMLSMGVYARIHVRFYGIDGHTADCNSYSVDAWDSWTAAYPASRIFLGLPASLEAAKEGYLYPKSLYYGVLPAVQKAANYGGVMLWDRYYDERSNYSSYAQRWA